MMMYVRCGPNGPVLRQGKRRKLRDGRCINSITPEDGIVQVEYTRYYRRLTTNGDLILESEPPAKPVDKPKTRRKAEEDSK